MMSNDTWSKALGNSLRLTTLIFIERHPMSGSAVANGCQASYHVYGAKTLEFNSNSAVIERENTYNL